VSLAVTYRLNTHYLPRVHASVLYTLIKSGLAIDDDDNDDDDDDDTLFPNVTA
jgi:hypothetical protein